MKLAIYVDTADLLLLNYPTILMQQGMSSRQKAVETVRKKTVSTVTAETQM